MKNDKAQKKPDENQQQKKKTEFKYPEIVEKPRIIHDCIYPEIPEATGGIREGKSGGKHPDTVRVELIKLRANPKVTIASPNDVYKILKDMEDYDREYAKVIYLDAKNRVIGIENVAEGTLGSASMLPREVVKGATLANAAGAIFIHNHPSGIPQPSKEDTDFIQDLVNAFTLMGISLQDGIIIGKEGIYSYQDKGKLPAPNPVFTSTQPGSISEECALAVRAGLDVMNEKCKS